MIFALHSNLLIEHRDRYTLNEFIYVIDLFGKTKRMFIESIIKDTIVLIEYDHSSKDSFYKKNDFVIELNKGPRLFNKYLRIDGEIIEVNKYFAFQVDQRSLYKAQNYNQESNHPFMFFGANEDTAPFILKSRVIQIIGNMIVLDGVGPNNHRFKFGLELNFVDADHPYTHQCQFQIAEGKWATAKLDQPQRYHMQATNAQIIN